MLFTNMTVLFNKMCDVFIRVYDTPKSLNMKTLDF